MQIYLLSIKYTQIKESSTIILQYSYKESQFSLIYFGLVVDPIGQGN